MKNPVAHLFICTNQRSEGASCGGRGAAELREAVKAACKTELSADHGKFRVNASGCLGRCEKGITAVLYPQGKWFERLSTSDVDLLKEEIQQTLNEKN